MPAEVDYQAEYLVEILCSDSAEQEEVYNRMVEEGYKCKVSTL